MLSDKAFAAPPSKDRPAPDALRALIDGKVRTLPTGPERLGDILERVVPPLERCHEEQDESS